MSYTLAQARDLLTKHIVDSWVTGAYNSDNLVFDDIVRDSNPDDSQTWARVKIRHRASKQKSLSDDTGKSRFERMSELFIQVFTPRGDGLTANDAASQVLLNALEGQSVDKGCIWFRDVSSKEDGPDGAFFRTTIYAQANYDQIK